MGRFDEPSELELQVLGVFWERGPLTVRQMLDALPDGKKRAYTSILSVLQVMERKGLITHRVEGKAHVYRPTVSRSHVLGPLLRRLVRNVFGGSSAAAVQHLLTETDMEQGDVEEIRRMLAKVGKEGESRVTASKNKED